MSAARPTYSPQSQSALDYARVAAAIAYLRAAHPRQPPLAEVAAHVRLSPAHFQRTFTAWAGVSPKAFARFLTVEYAKRLLGAGDEQAPSLFAVSDAAGLSSASRLHDAFVRLEAMTPGEFRGGGGGLAMDYSLADSPLGRVLIASTERGVSEVRFVSAGQEAAAVARLRERYPAARWRERQAPTHLRVEAALAGTLEPATPIALHLRGTDFQVQVWRALLSIAPGAVTTYGRLGAQLGRPRAGQAIGNAVGANPVAWLIPCHRVLRGDGQLGGYRWGVDRKVALLGREWGSRELAAVSPPITK